MRFMGAFTREEFEKLNDSDFENGDIVIVKDITKERETVSHYMYSKASDNYIILEFLSHLLLLSLVHSYFY